MSISARLYRNGKVEDVNFDPGMIDEVLAQDGHMVWVDLEEPTPEEVDLLGAEFGFHPLALEDCLHPHQRPKIEQYETHFFVVAYGFSRDGREMDEHEVALFVGRNYLVTVRKSPALDVRGAAKRWDAHSELAAEGGGYLLYVLLDEIVDGYFELLEELEDHAEELEDHVFEGTVDEAVQTRLFAVKKELMHFRRRAAPLREVLDVMQRQIVPVVTNRLEPYYRDVYDHVLRATDFVDTLRDLLNSALDASLAVVSNRLNEAMKRLASWAGIILVPTLIAGIYGMNFQHMPELGWFLGYPFALGVMVLSGGVLYVLFRRRGWL